MLTDARRTFTVGSYNGARIVIVGTPIGKLVGNTVVVEVELRCADVKRQPGRKEGADVIEAQIPIFICVREDTNERRETHKYVQVCFSCNSFRRSPPSAVNLLWERSLEEKCKRERREKQVKGMRTNRTSFLPGGRRYLRGQISHCW